MGNSPFCKLDCFKALKRSIADTERLLMSRPGAYIIKLITAVIYSLHNKLLFFPGKPFQPSLVFITKHSCLLQKP